MTTWYVRKSGSDSNGGSSASATPDQQGTDGTITNATTAFTAASGAFTAGDVGKGINIGGTLYRVTARSSATAVTLDRNYAGTTTTTATWKLGGACLTVAKLTNVAGSAVLTVVLAGESIYVGAGTYREVFAPGSYLSQGSGPALVGDVDGAQTGDSGEVRMTTYTTDDKTAPSGSAMITMAPYWTVTNFVFVNGTGVLLSSVNATQYTFQDCTFLSPYTGTWSITRTLQSTAVVHFYRCIIFSPAQQLSHTLTSFSSGADYDANITYESCLIISPTVTVAASGALAKRGGGVKMFGCTMISTAGSSTPAFQTTSAALSTTSPCKVENSVLMTPATTVLSANTSGQITEDYNWLGGGSRTNVTAGTHSIADGSYAGLISVGQEIHFLANLRPFGMPVSGSPLLGFGSSGNGLATDLLNASRPSGGSSASKAIGCLERSNTAAKETSTVHTGANAMKIVGPGYQDFLVPVSNVTITLSMYLRYDSTYAGSKPYIQLLNAGEVGSSGASASATTAALNAWQQLSITFTPTKAGIVTFRVASQDTNGAGTVYADTFGVA